MGLGASITIGTEEEPIVLDGAVSFTLDVAALGREATLDLILQAGDEGAVVDLTFGEVGRDAELNVNVQTGAGDDTLNIDVGAMGRDAQLTLDFQTNDGDDALDLIFGDIGRDAKVSVTGDLGAGVNTELVEFTGNVSVHAQVMIDIDNGEEDEQPNDNGAEDEVSQSRRGHHWGGRRR